MTAPTIDFKAVQDAYLEFSKEILLETQRLVPLAFIFHYRKHSERVKETGLNLEFVRPKDEHIFKELESHEIVAGVVPRILTWKDEFTVIHRSVPDKAKEMLDTLMLMGRKMFGLTGDKLYMHGVKGIRRAFNLDEADVIQMAVQQVAAAVKAFAVIQVSEAYTYFGSPNEKIDRKKYPTMKDHPDSKEVIMCSLQSRHLSRCIVIEIKRRGGKKDVGEVLGYGEFHEMSSETVPGSVVMGRLVNVLPPEEPEAQQ